MKITYQIAMAAGRDAANRNMRKNGRAVWNEEYHIIACDVINNLLRKAA